MKFLAEKTNVRYWIEWNEAQSDFLREFNENDDETTDEEINFCFVRKRWK